MVVDHILHLLEVAGPDHVGLGSDFDGADEFAEGLEDPGCFPGLIRDLKKRGLDDETTAKVMGGNLLRMFESKIKTGITVAHLKQKGMDHAIQVETGTLRNQVSEVNGHSPPAADAVL